MNSSLHEECNNILMNNTTNLFISCCFYFVGFEGDEWMTSTNSNSSNAIASATGSSNSHNSSSRRNDKQNLSRIIRKCLGTIYWDVHESITHVIVADGIDSKLRNDVINFCRYHPNTPVAISPYWIIESVRDTYLQPCHLYPPLEKKNTAPPPPLLPTSIFDSLEKPNVKDNKNDYDNKNMTKKIKQRSTLFEGILFYIIPPPTPLSNVNDKMIIFDIHKVEELIISQGGILLSNQILHSLKDNTHNGAITTTSSSSSSSSGAVVLPMIKQDKCYLVHLAGKFNVDDTIQNDILITKFINVMKSKRKNNNIQELLIPVNPIWIETCTLYHNINKNDTQITSPSQYPILFQPQSYYPLYKLPQSLHHKIKVSVTGFQNTERIGIKQLLLCIGAVFTETMGNDNTHLICKEAKGPKYHKAIEWGLFVIKIDWLYHIVRFGYFGEDDTHSYDDGDSTSMMKKGCEHEFSISFSPRRVQPVMNVVGVDDIVKDQAFVDSSTTLSKTKQRSSKRHKSK